MAKKFIVRLSESEKATLKEIVKNLKGSRARICRANILLMVDATGPNWEDGQVAEAYHCSRRTVENVRRRLVTGGFEFVLNGARRNTPPTPKKLDGRQEAEIIALRLSSPPDGYGSWSLRLLARRTVELNIAGSVSHETVRKTLKKRL
jgi:hypothetical protein